ncbi:MAG: glycoside hydrolase 43 family protein [Butyrivibrio sp.]|uniref:glycoside hydrolase family 43 protein n=1 Tax=Butyrivibrio sp. TaxID=28121 RepID=UPI0025D814EF|nr:glycoside hydrolase 43 family protein [Butyrivibrio sp.]MCR5773138.1 glycoside hydrolase 43 family protein [Butyrivibrio sp.]
MQSLNPIIKTDYPDPEVIRVGNTYYMASTTMYFFPGCAILRSYDLKNWEIVNYVFDKLEDSSAENLEREESIYGHGMWAPTLRFHNGTYYVAFSSVDIKKTYFFTTDDIENGTWDKHYMEGFFHDLSLLFDDDGRVYVIYGNKDIWITELEPDLSEIKKDGLSKIIISDTEDVFLGYEGAHAYKIDGYYYIFLIHWPVSTGIRTQVVYRSKSLDGGYEKRDLVIDDIGNPSRGVAQGGIVDTPDGKWVSFLFQDCGAVGRAPVIVPLTFKDGFPYVSDDCKVPSDKQIIKFLDGQDLAKGHKYDKLYTSDDFVYDVRQTSHPKLKMQWQWNHLPSDSGWKIKHEGGLEIKNTKIATNLVHAKNMLTQRMMMPKCEAIVTADISGLKDGDVAGICALQGCYGLVGVRNQSFQKELVVMVRKKEEVDKFDRRIDFLPGNVVFSRIIDTDVVRLKICADFTDNKDTAYFYYDIGDGFIDTGIKHKLHFGLDHFTGCRFGLFNYATKQAGGKVVFNSFEYEA